MWALENQTPFAAERTFVRDRDGSEIFLVAVRASFQIQPNGQLDIAEKQEPVAQAPQYLGKPGKSSLRCDTDLPRTKLGTDVLLNASAHVPGGREREEIEVGFQIGTLKKFLLVSGDQTWQSSFGMSTPGGPKDFSKMPIKYERSYGGATNERTSKSQYPFAECNPIGVGIDSSDEAALPNIRYPGTRVEAPRTKDPPAGLGAVSCAWMPRRSHAGTYDAKWQRDRQPLLPEDFQDEFFYSAPNDQRVPGFLRGGEKVELFNLTPNGYLSFVLPKLVFGFRTSIDGGVTNHRSDLHCVLIEPDQQRLIMVWHTALPCHHTLYTLKRTVVFEKRERESHVA